MLLVSSLALSPLCRVFHNDPYFTSTTTVALDQDHHRLCYHSHPDQVCLVDLVCAMKTPKLKNYYLAVPPDGYAEFERTRTLPITGIHINLTTGQTQGREHWFLAATPNLADELVRETFRYGGTVYVLRIPADCVDRSLLKLAPNQTQIWQYPQTITVPHCAVYRYDMKPAQNS